MTETPAENLDKIIWRVNKLLEKAESTEYPEEAKALRAKAKELIDQHRIDQENMIAVDQKTVMPILREFPVARWSSEFRDWFWTLFLHVAEHCEVEVTSDYGKTDQGEIYLMGKAVGYDIDLRYMELLWSSIRLTFISKVEPEYDPNLSEAENIYRLRSSGIARKDVAQMIWGQWTHANSAKVGKVYKEECAKRGETPALSGKGIHLKDFRETYAKEFTWRVVDRLHDAANGALGQGGAMVFADRKERVKEAFYKHFPNLRPKPVEPVVPVVLTDEEQAKAQAEAEKARKRLEKRRGTKAYQKELHRKYWSPAAQAGSMAGKSAADQVNISRTADRTDRLGGQDATELGA